MKHLSDAPFLGRLLALPTNIRLGTDDDFSFPVEVGSAIIELDYFQRRMNRRPN